MVAADEEATAKANGPFDRLEHPGPLLGLGVADAVRAQVAPAADLGTEPALELAVAELAARHRSVVLGDPALAERPHAQDYPRERSVASPPSTPIT